jgi:hypothetical protein
VASTDQTNFPPPHPAPAIPSPAQPVPKLPPVWLSNRYNGYVWTIAICIVLLYILNNILQNYIMPLDPNISKDYPGFIVWIINGLAAAKVTFLTKEFISCLWAVNTALTLAILAYFSFLLYRPRWYCNLIQAFVSLIAILPFFVIYHKFPLFFSTSRGTETAKVVLFVIMGVFALAFLIDFVRFVRLRLNRDFS